MGDRGSKRGGCVPFTDTHLSIKGVEPVKNMSRILSRMAVQVNCLSPMRSYLPSKIDLWGRKEFVQQSP